MNKTLFFIILIVSVLLSIAYSERFKVTELTDPVEIIKLTDPIESTDSAEGNAQVNLTGSTDPIEIIKLTDPAEGNAQVNLTGSKDPIGMAGLIDSARSTGETKATDALAQIFAGSPYSQDQAKDSEEAALSRPPSPAESCCIDRYDDFCKRACLDTISVWGSFIYWQASQDFMDVGLKSQSSLINSECGTSFCCGKRVEMDSDFAPGFMVGAEYHGHHAWDIAAEYTHFHSENHKSASSPSCQGFLFARWIQPNLVANNAVSHLSTRWDLDLNVLNLEIKKWCHCGHRLLWRPFFGVEAAWIDQRFHGDFSLTSPPLFLKVRNTSDSWGIGPRIGVDWKWRFNHLFSFVGDVATVIFFTHYDLKLKQDAAHDATIFICAPDHLTACRPELEVYFGLNYETYFCKRSHPHKRRARLNLQVGYDAQVWWNQNMMRWYNDSTFIATPQGNLYLRGLRLTAKLDF